MGLIGTCTTTLTVQEALPPSIGCPAALTVPNDLGQCGAVVTYTTPVGLDAWSCPGVPNPVTVQTTGLPSGSSFPVGKTTNTFKVTSANGASALCRFVVTVTDSENPHVTCPANVVVNAGAGQCFAIGVALGTPTTSDNCGVAGLANNAPAQFPVGLTTVTWTVTDICGNKATCAQTVTVHDSQAPVITTCPPAPTLTAGAGGTVALPDLAAAAVATDNCGTPTLQQAPAAATQVPAGTTSVVITARDAAGNTSTCTVVVTVQSGVKPEPAIAVLETGEVKVYWPAAATGWNLYSTPELKDPATVWTKVSSSLYRTNNGVIYILVTNPVGQPNTFYRLKNP
ncbi:MAG: HYR domain-containing protein [Verrucomicrobia bacterium]|nr:HYR domain-containing protein [Verrucomicrobiota bacterium]